MKDPHAICRKWVRRIGGGFHPDTRGKDYSPAMSAAEIAEYDSDMNALFANAADPYECAIMAMDDAGLTEGNMMDTQSAYWLGVRDARLGHAETAPVRPYTRAELEAYRQGYSDQRATMATMTALTASD